MRWHFLPAISVYVLVSVATVIAPLLTFISVLWTAKHSGRYTYGTLAVRYTLAFHEKWILRRAPSDEPLLGTGDIQSLADLGNSFAFVERMSIIPMGPRTPIHLAVACMLPLTPLLLTMMPLEAIVKTLIKVAL